MRAILGCAVLFSLPLWGFGDVSGNFGLRADWGEHGGTASSFLDLRWSHRGLSLGAGLSLPLPGLDWSLALRGSLERGSLRFSLQGGLSPEGLVYLRQDLRFSPESWDLPSGQLRASARLGLYTRGPLDAPSLTVTGSGVIYGSWEDLWAEATVELALYPFPPGPGRKGLSLGYRPHPFWVALRNHFLEGWDRSTAELGYQDTPLRASLQAAFGPGGFQGANLLLSLDLDPFRLSLSAGLTPQGPSPAALSLGFTGGWGEVLLRATVAFPLEFRGGGVEVRIPF